MSLHSGQEAHACQHERRKSDEVAYHDSSESIISRISEVDEICDITGHSQHGQGDDITPAEGGQSWVSRNTRRDCGSSPGGSVPPSLIET